MGETRGVTVQRLARGRRRGRFEGVWVQRAAGKSDCGEAGGGVDDVVVVVVVSSKGSRFDLCMSVPASGSVCASGATLVSAAQ